MLPSLMTGNGDGPCQLTRLIAGEYFINISLRESFRSYILNEHYPSRWFCRGSPISSMPLSWPPCSPELATPGNTLCCIIKEKVAAHRCRNNDKLRKAVEHALTTITQQMLWRMSHRTWRCIRLYFQHDSAYTDQLDVR
jgi:hypothetical protein